MQRFTVVRWSLHAAVAFATTVGASRGSAQQAVQHPTFAPDHPTGIYAAGERVGWTVTLPKGVKAAGPYSYTVLRNGGERLSAGTLDLSKGRARIETSLAEPAMLVGDAQAASRTTRLADRLFRPPMRGFALMDWHRITEAAEAGYQYARGVLREPDALAAVGRPGASPD